MEQVFCFCLMSLGSKIQPQDILHTKLPAMVTSLRDDYLFLMCLNDIAVSLFQNPDLFRADGISKKLGIIGFCFGGGQVIDVLAADLGACFGTDVSFYGTRMNPGAASKIKLPVLFL
ncbi:hypothetical protein V6N12_000223 [Hibiscus sabdariffa]|uniref:Carboxymethylenebutenolidase homolog n=1 Tax=Hibiscus sabdariffa TaxID=183260 RepID=A0ABR1ZF48_9ROSI